MYYQHDFFLVIIIMGELISGLYTVQFLFFLPLYSVLCGEKSTMWSTYLQSKTLCSTILRTENINSEILFCMGDSSVIPNLVITYKFKLILAHEYSIYMMTYNSTLLYIPSCVEFYLWLLRSFPHYGIPSSFCLF